MTYRDIKLRGNGYTKLWQLILSGVAIIVTVLIALSSWAGKMNDKIAKQNETILKQDARLEILQALYTHNAEWRAETSVKLDEISKTVTDIRIQIGYK